MQVLKSMADKCDLYLTGKCLVSMPNMDDERFAGTLIYICSHSKEGAMGFVVNKKSKNSPLLIWLTNFRSIRYTPSNPLTSIRAGRLKKCAVSSCIQPIISNPTLW